MAKYPRSSSARKAATARSTAWGSSARHSAIVVWPVWSMRTSFDMRQSYARWRLGVPPSARRPLDGRQPVDRDRVLLGDVRGVGLRPAGAQPLGHRELAVRPAADHLHERHVVAAGVGDALDVDAHDGTLRGGLPGLREVIAARREDLTGAVQAQDARRAVEGAEHDHDAAVLAQVRDGLGAGPDVVEIGDLARAEHLEGPDRALGRDVDVAVGAQRGGADEEHRLAHDPLGEPLVDAVVDVAHTAQTPSFSRTRRVTSAPSARPCVSRMTWPMIAPIAFMLPPLIFSAASALAASAASTIGASSSPPPIAASPSASTIASGSPPSATSLSSTCLPAFWVTFLAATRPTRRARASGVTFASGSSSSSTRCSSSLRTQLASTGASTSPFAERAAS